MTTPETRSKYAPKPVPYGEFFGPFFDPEMLERISQRGNRPVNLVGFMSAYGLHVITEKTNSIFDLLCSEGYGLEEVLQRTPQGDIIFPSKTILQVARAMEFAFGERQMIEAIVGGTDLLSSLLKPVRSGS